MRRYIGDKLKQAMRQANKTPEDISDALNIPLGTIYGYMNDIYAPELRRGKNIADYLGCSMDDLYGQNKIKAVKKKPLSIDEIEKLARQQGMSYGEYVKEYGC